MLAALAQHFEAVGLGDRWWIGAGTLLGLHRHGGIVPWDADADVFVLADPTDAATTRADAVADVEERIMSLKTAEFKVARCDPINYGRAGQALLDLPRNKWVSGKMCQKGCMHRRQRRDNSESEWWPTKYLGRGMKREDGTPVNAGDRSGVICSTAFKMYSSKALKGGRKKHWQKIYWTGTKVDIQVARRDSAAEDFCRLKAPCCTAMAWIFIPADCFAIRP